MSFSNTQAKPAEPSRLTRIGTRFLSIMSGLYDAAEVITHEMHGHAPPATIIWVPPTAITWTPGGFVLGSAQLNATTDRGDLPLAYQPGAGTVLSAGTHTLTATLDTDEYEANPVSVQFTVDKAVAAIQWVNPPAIAWQEGGLPLGPAQLNAVTVPPGLHLDYVPDHGDTLDPGTHSLAATLASADYQAIPAQVQFVVNPAPATINWQPPDAVNWTPGGIVPGPAQLNAMTTPAGLPLTYTPPTQGGLGVGKHPVTVSLAPGTHYVAAPVTVDVAVTQLPVTIEVTPMLEATWSPEGLDAAVIEQAVKTTPPGIAIAIGPQEFGKLPVGKHDLTISVADTVNCVAQPKPLKLVLVKPRATIAWDKLEPIPFVAGGVTPGPMQKTAVTTPPGLKLLYSWEPKGPLGLGDHVLTAALDPLEMFVAEPVSQKLMVERAQAVLTWSALPKVKFVRGGCVLGPEVTDLLNNPSRVQVEIIPKLGTKLSVDTHRLTATCIDPAFNAKPAMADLIVEPANAVITWHSPPLVTWKAEGNTFDDTLRTATTNPPALLLDYTLEEGEPLTPGKTKVTVSLSPREKGFVAKPVTVTIEYKLNREQLDAYNHQQRVAKIETAKAAEEAKKRPKLTKEQEQAQQRQRAEMLQQAEALEQQEVGNSMLKAEYPIGAANVVPHIHSYASGFHLKILQDGKVKRFNVVQDNLRMVNADETLGIAWAYDRENGTRIRKVLQALLNQFE